MKNTNTQIDDYINKSAEFAKPILNHIRKIIHDACPQVQEEIKWSFPNFTYKKSILCSMAAFKNHCSFGFWLSAKMDDPEKILTVTERTGMGNLGQLKSINDLASDEILVRYIINAMELIDKGVKLAKKPAQTSPASIEIPGYFIKELGKNILAKNHFDAFPPSHKKEYIEWFTEAKTDATREKRMATALEWISEGKGRNWKYER